MTVLQIEVPEQQEKEIRLILKGMGVVVKKIKSGDAFTKKIKNAVQELNDVKDGKIKARSFDDLLNEI